MRGSNFRGCNQQELLSKIELRGEDSTNNQKKCNVKKLLAIGGKPRRMKNSDLATKNNYVTQSVHTGMIL